MLGIFSCVYFIVILIDIITCSVSPMKKKHEIKLEPGEYDPTGNWKMNKVRIYYTVKKNQVTFK